MQTPHKILGLLTLMLFIYGQGVSLAQSSGTPPLLLEYNKSVGVTEPLVLRFDQPIQLIDGSLIEVINFETGVAVPMASISVQNDELTLEPVSLDPDERLVVRLGAGVVGSTSDASVNETIVVGVYSGVYEVLELRSFTEGLEGFIPAHSLGIVPLTVRVWDWMATRPNEPHPGPSGDFGWIGRDRGPMEDFIASPSMDLIAGVEYTLRFQYEGIMRLDLRSELVLDRSQTPLAITSGSGTRNITFTAETSGPQHVLFAFNGSSSLSWCRLDNVSMVRTVRPAIYVASPAEGFVMAEGNPLNIAGSALAFSAALQDVRIFLDDRLVGTFATKDFDLWVHDYDPGVQEVRIVARDINGQETEWIRPITITFADGTLSPFVQYSFRDGLEGVTVGGGNWTNGYISIFSSSGIGWISSPLMFLQAGESYTFQFDAHRGDSSSHVLNLSLEGMPGYPANATVLASFDVNQSAWVTYSVTIQVEASGPYYFTLANDGTRVYNRVWVDNIRVIGSFNSAPTIQFTAPANNTVTLAGAPMTLRASASDADGQVTRVDFWNGSLLIGSVLEPPYEWLWESAPVGELEISAIAYDNTGGFSNPATVTIQSLDNRVNIATNLGSATVAEAIYGMEYQSDGTLVIAGIINPEFFSQTLGVGVQWLPTASAGDNGIVALLSHDGRTVYSVSVVGESAVDISLDAQDNIYLAAGTTGILKLNPTADTILWHYSPSDMGIPTKRAHRIDTAANGMTAALMSPTSSYGVQTLSAGDIALVHPNGSLHAALMSGSGSTYTTDIAVDSDLERIWIAGWKNFVTFEGVTTFPVDVPIFLARSYASENFNERVIRGYDWESNNQNGRWLNQLDNNMADTRTQRISIAPNGDVYIGLEYDGGNTPIRYDPYDLSIAVEIVGGDSHHNNAFTSTVPKVAVIRIDRYTGAFKAGQYLINRLNNGADNTLRLRGGQMMVDAVGRVHVVGESASGTPLTFDALPGVYNGGAVHWVLSPDLSTREMVTRWASAGSFNAVAVSPTGKVAVGGNVTGDNMYRRRAVLEQRQSSSDALLVVGDFAQYYSFQPGNHPRMFFTAQDVPELRYRATQAPYDEMVQRMIESLDDDGGYRPINLQHSYSRSLRAKTSAFLYIVTGDENFAALAREDVEWVINSTHIPWADTTTKGLESFWMAAHIALAYDWCAMSPLWDDAFLFQVSKALLDIGKVIINHGGTEQNTAPSSNWQGARGAAGGLALLATDSRFDPTLLDSAYHRVRNYINLSIGSHPETRGWADEGLGYTYYPYGLFIGPFAEAMERMKGQDLRNETAISAAYRSLLASPTAAVNVYDYGGIKPDWANDNMHIRGEGVFGQSFYFIEPELLPAARWVYDRLMGPLARDRARWDDTRGGAIWSFLHYPANVVAQSPLEFYSWHTANADQHGIGITAFRNQYEDENDILAQFKARLFASGGHDGPDGLGIRIIGNDTAWVVGGGRDAPGRNIGQPTLYKVEPGAQLNAGTNMNTGSLVGSPLIKVDGSGHVIGQMATNNMGVQNHKRWFVTDFDHQATGAQAAFLIADTSSDATYWQLPTSPFNTITINGHTFTITAPNGATLHGTVLHPAGATLNHGTRVRGGDFAPLYGGSQSDIDPILNPQVPENKFITVQGSGGDFLVALTIQPAGDPHPAVTRTGGQVADAVVQIGNRSYAITADNILYDGTIYTHPEAQIVFDAGAGQVVEGDINQVIAYGGTPVAPQVAPPAGHVFLGWNRSFDAITRDMLIEALYAPLETIPTAPSFLRGSALTGGSIVLQWNDNSLGELGFTVEESVDGGSTWTAVAQLGENTQNVTLTGRSALTQYSYRVRADGSEAPSTWSNVLVLHTPPLNQPPFFTTTPPDLAHEGSLFSYYVQAEDPDEDSLTLTLVDAPEWLTLYNTGGGGAVLTGVPVADAESVDIVISVTDGIHPPVEQPFTLTINPAPVITLEWPLQLPVYLQPEHAINAVVSVEDTLPVTLSWAIIQGPLGSSVSAPNAESTDLYFDRAGTYIVRITATDSAGATRAHDFHVLVDREPSRDTVEVLAFDDQNNYTDGVGRDFRGMSPETLNLDINGDGITDQRRWLAFSHLDSEGNWMNPLSPAYAAGVHGGRFFGGLVAERFGATGLNFNPQPQIDANNRISIKFGSAHTTRIHAAIFWSREDFKEVDASMDVVLGLDSRFDIQFNDFRDTGDIRWMVLANGKFYLSQTKITNTAQGRVLDGFQIGSQLWAEYFPTSPIGLNFDQDSAVFDVSTSELGTIEGVGLMVDADDYSFSRRFWMQIRNFKLRAEIGEAFHASPIIAIPETQNSRVGDSVELTGSVDFANTNSLTEIQWSVVYGPGTVTFADDKAATTSASASHPGQYMLRLYAADEFSSSFREILWEVEPEEIVYSTSLEDWLENHFAGLEGGSAHSDAGLGADPDRDGIPNLLEFALSGNPFIPFSATLPVIDHINHNGNLHLRLTVDKNPNATDIAYIVEVSGDLSNWSSVEGEDVHTHLNTNTSLIVEDAKAVTPDTPRFIRLRVQVLDY